VVPFAPGCSLGFAIPDSLVGEGTSRVIFSLFLATALAISALPVIARVLVELDLMRRNIRPLTVAAATVDDVVGWVMLGAVAGAARSGQFEGMDVVLRL